MGFWRREKLFWGKFGTRGLFKALLPIKSSSSRWRGRFFLVMDSLESAEEFYEDSNWHCLLQRFGSKGPNRGKSRREAEEITLGRTRASAPFIGALFFARGSQKNKHFLNLWVNHLLGLNYVLKLLMFYVSGTSNQ